MNIQEFSKTDNWFDYSWFYNEISKQDSVHRIVEIGSWKGHSISYLANLMRNVKPLEIYAVDLWDDVAGYTDVDWIKQFHKKDLSVYDAYNFNLQTANVRHLITDIKCDSQSAASKFPDKYFDFVYIDADHTYDSVTKDMEAWFSKVKPGGFFSGHDFDVVNGKPNSVASAVVDFCKKRTLKLMVNRTVWLLIP